MEALQAEKEKELAKLGDQKKSKNEMERGLEELEHKLEKITTEDLNQNETVHPEEKADKEKMRLMITTWLRDVELPKCGSCGLVCANGKQLLMHVNGTECSHEYHPLLKDQLARWERHDMHRTMIGCRVYNEIYELAQIRPHTDFIEDLDAKLWKVMDLDSEKGLVKTRVYLATDEARKVYNRFIRHIRDTDKGLACRVCYMGCKNDLHYLIHINTYYHREKVRGTSFERLSILVGWFSRECYLRRPEKSETDFDCPPDPSISIENLPELPQFLLNWKNDSENDGENGQEEEKEEEECSRLMEMKKAVLLMHLQAAKLLNCKLCNCMYTNDLQYLMHIRSDEHTQNVAMVDQSPEDTEDEKAAYAEFRMLFKNDLEVLGYAERKALEWGRDMYGRIMRKDETRPTIEFMEKLNGEIGKEVKKMPDGNYGKYFAVAESYFMSAEANKLMKEFEKHIAEKRVLVCDPCRFAADQLSNFIFHFVSYGHVRTTQNTVHELPTVLFGVNNRKGYESYNRSK